MRRYEHAAVETGVGNGLVGHFHSAVHGSLSVWTQLNVLKQQGYHPDVCICHLGWGDSLFVREVFPETPVLGYCEFYYHSRSADTDFDPEYPASDFVRLRCNTLNAVNLLGLAGCTVGVSPTRWQRQLFPAEFRSKIQVVHEGVDADYFRPDSSASFTLPGGGILSRNDEVVTYAARNLEPYRGFHIFMRAAEIICRRRPRCHIVVAGGDEVSYGARPTNGLTFREQLCREITFDGSRLHFVGKLSLAAYRRLLQISSAHVYLTVPFVLSWSVIEAMSCQCTLVASDTPPVREVLHHERNAILADFFSPVQIAEAVDRVLDDRPLAARLSACARADALEHFRVEDAVSRYEAVANRLTGCSFHE